MKILLKRFFDFLFALLGLVLLMPFFMAVALVIKLSMPGPVFFRQVRIGHQGKPFKILKFRSMRVSDEESSITLESDSRITPFGRFLRRSKIDELPQLWNILKGEMSLVGPRPDVPAYASKLEGEDRIILSVKPGITGPDSLAFPNEERLLATQPDPEKYYHEVIYPEKLRINREYTRNRTFRHDLLILWKTFRWISSKKSL